MTEQTHIKTPDSKTARAEGYKEQGGVITERQRVGLMSRWGAGVRNKAVSESWGTMGTKVQDPENSLAKLVTETL